MVGARLGLELVINSASIASLFLALSPALCLFASLRFARMPSAGPIEFRQGRHGLGLGLVFLGALSAVAHRF